MLRGAHKKEQKKHGTTRCRVSFFCFHSYRKASEICPDCGVREALEDAGLGPGTKREIMVRMIKERYKPGIRVRLLYMNDRQSPPVGTEGTVRGVDDIGSVMVAWDNGCGLNVVLEEDEIEVI